jgi:hypothetical protein
LWIALGLVAVLGLIVVSRLVPDAATVDRVTVRNGTVYDLDVDATGAGRDGWTPVGIAIARSDTSMKDVIDSGDVWIFRFSGQGRDGGELRVTRSQLEADDWEVSVPASVGDRIRASGAPPSPAPRGA